MVSQAPGSDIQKIKEEEEMCYISLNFYPGTNFSKTEERKERLKKKAKLGQKVGSKAVTGELEGGADLNICCRPPYCSEITPLQCAVCRPYCSEIAPLQRTSALQTLDLIAVK